MEKVLRGRPFDKVLVGSTRDGLDIQPLYTADDAMPTPVPAAASPTRLTHGWDVRQVHEGGSAGCALGIVAELERGVTSIELRSPADGWTTERLDAAIAGVLLDLAPICLAPHADLDAARALHAVIAARGDLETTGSWLGLDPMGATSRGEHADLAACAALAAELAPTLPAGRTITVDSSRYGDAGATEAEELGWSIASAVAVLRALESAGMSIEEAANTIAFRIGIGADQFMTIAVLRALRVAWARVLEVCGVPADAAPAVVQAVTGAAMYSRRDPWVNMLRGTTAALAAGVGGADAVTVLPFDDAVGQSDDFARRVARNTQLLLVEESHLARVVDPAAGSWFVESLTGRLATAAWSVFQGIEADGGMEAALESGRIQDSLDASWAARLDALGTRRQSITGVSEFPDLDETLLTRPAPATSTAGFPVRRLAAPFEELRDAADRHLADTGARPTVHLATLHDLATHTARSAWIANLLAVGGIAADGGDTDGATSPIEAEARFVDSGCTVAVICSSDGVYAERAAATATALKEAGALHVVLAGAPGDLRAELDAAGVDEYWHVGVDVLDALTRLHATLGL